MRATWRRTPNLTAIFLTMMIAILMWMLRQSRSLHKVSGHTLEDSFFGRPSCNSSQWTSQQQGKELNRKEVWFVEPKGCSSPEIPGIAVKPFGPCCKRPDHVCCPACCENIKGSSAMTCWKMTRSSTSYGGPNRQLSSSEWLTIPKGSCTGNCAALLVQPDSTSRGRWQSNCDLKPWKNKWLSPTDCWVRRIGKSSAKLPWTDRLLTRTPHDPHRSRWNMAAATPHEWRHGNREQDLPRTQQVQGLDGTSPMCLRTGLHTPVTSHTGWIAATAPPARVRTTIGRDLRHTCKIMSTPELTRHGMTLNMTASSLLIFVKPDKVCLQPWKDVQATPVEHKHACQDCAASQAQAQVHCPSTPVGTMAFMDCAVAPSLTGRNADTTPPEQPSKHCCPDLGIVMQNTEGYWAQLDAGCIRKEGNQLLADTALVVQKAPAQTLTYQPSRPCQLSIAQWQAPRVLGLKTQAPQTCPPQDDLRCPPLPHDTYFRTTVGGLAPGQFPHHASYSAWQVSERTYAEPLASYHMADVS